MTISELIKQLEAYKFEHGDLEVKNEYGIDVDAVPMEQYVKDESTGRHEVFSELVLVIR